MNIKELQQEVKTFFDSNKIPYMLTYVLTENEAQIETNMTDAQLAAIVEDVKNAMKAGNYETQTEEK